MSANPDPGSVSAVWLGAEEQRSGDERGVEADPGSGLRAGRRINVCLSRTKMSKFVWSQTDFYFHTGMEVMSCQQLDTVIKMHGSNNVI